MKKRKVILLILLWLCAPLLGRGVWGEVHAQQDAQYSQYMFNPLAINPAYAGSRDAFSTALVYRNQWTGIQGSPTTASFSAQMPLKRKKVGLGAEIYSDKLGPRAANAFQLSYAYRIPFLKGKLSFGLRMGIIDYVFDGTKMDYKDQSDVYNTQTRSAKITGTADFGWRYYTRTFYWGMCSTHLNQGRMDDFEGNSTHQVRHFFMTLGKSWQIGNAVLNPVWIIKSAKGAPSTSDFGLNLLIKEKLWVGMSARSRYGLVLLSQYIINEHFTVGYSYDLGSNKIGRAGGSTHEIMIKYDMNILGTKIIMPRYM